MSFENWIYAQLRNRWRVRFSSTAEISSMLPKLGARALTTPGLAAD